MELWQIAIPIRDRAETREVLNLLRKLRVRMDPCARNPSFEIDSAGNQRLVVLVNARALGALRESAHAFEIVRDLADMPDPRNYVSKANRYAEELARLLAEKSRH